MPPKTRKAAKKIQAEQSAVQPSTTAQAIQAEAPQITPEESELKE